MLLPILKFLLYGLLPGFITARIMTHNQPRVSLAESLTWTALSYPLVALVGLSCLLMGQSLAQASWFLDGLLLLLCSIYLIRLLHSRGHKSVNFCLPWDILLSVAGILIVFFPMHRPRNWFAHHGFWHVSIVNSFLAGHFPPENPGFAGEAISYVWLYHLWIALMALKTGLHPVFMNIAGHIHLLICLFGLSVLISQAWGYTRALPKTFGFWLLLGSINIGAFIHLTPYIVNWAISPSGLVESYQNHVSQNTHPLLSLTGTMLKIPVFHKSWSFLTKFFNFGAMAHGIAFFFFFVWSLHNIFEKQRTNKNWFVYGFSLLGLLLFYPVFIAFSISFASLYCGLRWWKDRCTGLVLKSVLLSAGICTVCLPYFLLMGTKTGTTNVPVLSLSFNPVHLWLYGLGPFWPLIPVVWYWFRKLRPLEKNPGKVSLISAGIITGLAFPVFVAIYGGTNNYKYVYLSSFFVTWAAVSVLLSTSPAGKERLWKCIRSGYVALALGPICLTVLGWSLGPWSRDSHFSLADQSIEKGGQSTGLEALKWISTETDKDAVLIVPLTQKDSKASTAYVPASLTDRSLYVVNDATWVGGYKLYNTRRRLVEYLWGYLEPGSGAIEFDNHLSHRPLYLLYQEDADQTTAFYSHMMGPVHRLEYKNGVIEDRINALGKHVRTVFEKDGFRILEIVEDVDNPEGRKSYRIK